MELLWSEFSRRERYNIKWISEITRREEERRAKEIKTAATEIGQSACGQGFIGLVQQKLNTDSDSSAIVSIPNCLSKIVADRVLANSDVTVEGLVKQWYPNCGVIKQGHEVTILQLKTS